jgi:hypothetical protein
MNPLPYFRLARYGKPKLKVLTVISTEHLSPGLGKIGQGGVGFIKIEENVWSSLGAKDRKHQHSAELWRFQAG